MRKILLALTLTGVVAAGALGPASAADVTVSLSNPGGSRTLYVEEVTGNSLGALDFGTNRSQPFRIRVVDDVFDRTGFSVSTSMTNLYLEDTVTSSLDFNTKIDSANVALGYPGSPINAQAVSALVAPLYDLSATVDGATCTTLTSLGASCTINLNDVTGKLQTLALSVNLADLTNLPLLPQVGDTGPFTNPAYAGVAATAPQPASPPAATSLTVVRGSTVDTTAVLTALKSRLDTVVAAATTATDLIDADVLHAALRDALGAAVYDALDATTLQAITAALVPVAEALVPASIRAQTGTYYGYTQLDVTVPSTAPGGTYKGTLVVTGLQP